MLKRITVGFGKQIRKVLPKKEPDLSKVKKICIFKVGAIGDVLMTTPLIRWLCARFPKAQIDYWVGKWSAPVLENNPHVDKVITFDEKAIFSKNLIALHQLSRRIRKANYDLMFVLDFSYLANLFAARCKVPVRIGFNRKGEGFPNTINAPYGQRRHDITSYLGIAKLVKARSSENTHMEIFFTPAEERFAKAFFKKHKLIPSKTVAIAPGGAKNPGMTLNIKRWPAERFALVAQAIAKKGKKILLIGGPGDKDTAKVVKALVPSAVDAVGKLSLRKSAALIKQCTQFICNDSGPMHISAAVGTPVVVIFGPTDPKKLAPQGKKHKVVWKHPGNIPCYVDGSLKPCPDKHDCIKRITVKDVLKAVR